MTISLIIGWQGSSQAQGATDILYMTEEYPPFNYTEDGQLRGIAVDILERVFAQLDSTLTRQRIKVFPWARGYHLVQSQPNTALFVMARTSERESLFKWVGPIATNRVVLISRKDREIVVGSEEDLRALKLGVIRDDVGQHLLLKAGIEPEQLDVAADAAVNIKKLDGGRIDAWAYGEPVAKWFLKRSGLDPANYETVFILQETYPHYAFHRDTSDELIRQFQAALDRLKTPTGSEASEYDRILAAYLDF